MRAAAFETTRPEPALVGQQHRNPAFAMAIEDEQRRVVGGFHHGVAGHALDCDRAEPSAPGGRVLQAAREFSSDGVAPAGIGEARIKTLDIHVAGREGRKHRGKGCLGDGFDTRHFRSRRDQQRAAVFHVLSDIVVVEHRQYAAVLVAVEDDEVEFLDLLDKELAGREGDEGELGDRRAVLLFRGAQNGEMDEIHRGVGFQEIAPGAFARMGLAGHQQHPEVFADALDAGDCAVVGCRDFRRLFLDRELDNVVAAARDFQRIGALLAGNGLGDTAILAIDADGDRQRGA